MKFMVEINLDEFGNEFQSVEKEIKEWVSHEIKKEIKKSPEWKDYVKRQIARVVDVEDSSS